MNENDIRVWIAGSDAMFDVAICRQAELPDTICVIDPDDFGQDIETAFGDGMGAFPIHRAQIMLQDVAKRTASKLAHTHAPALDIPVEGLRHAWFYAVFSELTSLVPIRHLARHYARRYSGKVIAIPLATVDFMALNGWLKNDVEVLYLAHELRRLGCPVFLFSEQAPKQARLTFTLSKRLLPKGYPRYQQNRDGTAVLSKTTLRRADYVSARFGTKTRRRPSVFSGMFAFRRLRRVGSFSVDFQNGPGLSDIQTYRVPKGAISATEAFETLVSPLTKAVAEWFRSELRDLPVKTAIVPDHASLEAGMLGAEVVRKGGTIQIWPHSANVVHMGAHSAENVCKVTMAAQSTAEVWAQSFGSDKLEVDAASVLPETPKAPGFDPGKPLQVVLFAGSHMLRRVPLFDNNRHKETWSKTLDAFQNMSCEMIIKHKGSWETREWIAARTQPDAALSFTNVHANKLMQPNMVFVCITTTSTAIFEGIARGIPGFVVRDIPVDETPKYSADIIPYLRSSQLAAFVGELNCKEAWTALLEKQKDWFNREISARP